MSKLVQLCCLLMLAGCVRVPDNVRPVENFSLPSYLGTWYEIARLDHPFERGLSGVSAEYTLRDDGSVRVVNRGYSAKEGKWKQAEGKARFVQGPDVGFLKVSFFGPFYGSYIVFALDHDSYQYALVSGPDHSYFWILARTTTLNPDLLQSLVATAAAKGFATDQLIFVEHE